MEKIYKIKVRTTFDPRVLYPSERRYSASIVLGLGVVHLALAITAFLLACLTLNYDQTSLEPADNFLNMNFFLVLTFTPCIVCLGALGAGLTALLAWKRWYIDHNITWFFCMSFASSITSSVALTLIAILLASIKVNDTTKNDNNNFKFVITLNILIATILEWLWSCLSTKISYVGMRNDYPDDITMRDHGSVVTIKSSNKQIIPPNLINYFSPETSRKLAKYLAISNRNAKNTNLPKDESNAEYKERVDKFLASLNNPDANLNV